jgi:hypothetical protein
MKRKILGLMVVLSLGSLPNSLIAKAEEAGEIEKQEAIESRTSTSAETWASEVQKKYSLTDDQMKAMKTAGLKGPGLAITAELAKTSGKTIDQIVAMRTTEKMGWGKIAKTLGVPPSTIGHSISSLHHDLHEKRESRSEKRKEERREDAKEEREEWKRKHADEKEERLEKKEERIEQQKANAKHR